MIVHRDDGRYAHVPGCNERCADDGHYLQQDAATTASEATPEQRQANNLRSVGLLTAALVRQHNAAMGRLGRTASPPDYRPHLTPVDHL